MKVHTLHRAVKVHVVEGSGYVWIFKFALCTSIFFLKSSFKLNLQNKNHFKVKFYKL